MVEVREHTRGERKPYTEYDIRRDLVSGAYPVSEEEIAQRIARDDPVRGVLAKQIIADIKSKIDPRTGFYTDLRCPTCGSRAGIRFDKEGKQYCNMCLNGREHEQGDFIYG